MPKWRLTMSTVKYWSWKFLTMLGIAPIYLQVISGGLAMLIPHLGQKLSKIPFLGFLDSYTATYRLTIAHAMSLVLLIAVWWLWERLLGVWMGGKDDVHGFDPVVYRKIISTLGMTVAVCDAALFYLATAKTTWGGSAISFSALLATAAYVTVLIFVSFVSCLLRKKKEIDDAAQNAGAVRIDVDGLRATTNGRPEEPAARGRGDVQAHDYHGSVRVVQ